MLDRAALGRFRATATHLDRRLRGPGALGAAAWGGLQDSAPRSALLSLHARADGVEPASWEHPTLTQVWFRRSDFVVPADAAGTFTRGALPRDPQAAAALERLADAVEHVCGGAPRPAREVAGAIPDLPDALLLRLASLTGRVRIRWDASRIDVVPAPRPDVDDEQARSQLLRRFLGWYGVVTPDRFARWAGVTRDDATATWAALAPQLVAVSLAGAARWAHTDDLGALQSAPAVTGVRLLPMNDPHLHLAGEVDAAEPALDPAAPGPDVTQRLLNSLTGRILLDGRLVGGWGRAGADVTLDPWIPLGPAADAVEAEAVSFATPLGRPARVRWLRPPGGASPTTRRRRG